ncbi:MAG: hypothetical protein ACK52J_04135 [bacterium]|jgi:periodic tryptophan protein 2
MALYSNFEKEINKGRFILEKKHHFFLNNARLNSAEYYEPLNLFIIGFKNGAFGIHNLIDNEITEI